MSISRKLYYLLLTLHLFIFILCQNAFCVFEQKVTINLAALCDRARGWLFLPGNSVLFLDFILFERALLSQLFCCHALPLAVEIKKVTCYVSAYLMALNKLKIFIIIRTCSISQQFINMKI